MIKLLEIRAEAGGVVPQGMYVLKTDERKLHLQRET